ncbi:MAG: DnaD domain protein [Ktedonobacterales bacterium]
MLNRLDGRAFAGFPAGANPYTPLPDAFFTTLLPEIEDIGELKVTLHLFWLLYGKQGTPRCASDRELLADRALRHALRRPGDPRPPEERLRAALELALARGTLLRVRVRVDGEIVAWYFFNTERSRAAINRLMEGDLSPEVLLDAEDLLALAPPDAVSPDNPALGSAADATPAASHTHSQSPPHGQRQQTHQFMIEVERPNIFTLYEQNIGLLLPLVAEELREAEQEYPREWVEEAFREAVQQNKRKWSYIRAILRRWASDGKGGEPHGAHGRYFG